MQDRGNAAPPAVGQACLEAVDGNPVTRLERWGLITRSPKNITLL